ncbi:MAG: hypothetical protein IT379_42435 [Deltaproteobacteria bacterium]|nr:hypothetical protein [Deltaproteobacteria bacterium]
MIGYSQTMSCPTRYAEDHTCEPVTGDDIPMTRTFDRYAAIDVDAGGRLHAASRSLAADDLLVVSDPALPDLDGDGWPEWVQWSIPNDPFLGRLCAVPADSCEGRYCASCGLPDPRFFFVVGSRTRSRLLGPLLGAGRQVFPDIDGRLETALAPHRARGDADPDYQADACPEPGIVWTRYEHPGAPTITLSAGMVRVDVPVHPSRCQGWDPGASGGGPTCTPSPSSTRLIHEIPWPPHAARSRSGTGMPDNPF